MPTADKVQIDHLKEVIDFLKTTHFAALRGYEQAVEELAKQGDYEGKDWSEPYEFLRARLNLLKSQSL